MTRAVGVDIGGTKITAARVSVAGEVEARASAPCPAATGGTAVLDAVAGLVREVAGDEALAGVGVGTAGVVDAGRGRIVSSTATFADWVGVDVAQGLRDRLGVERVEVRNDVDAHALGEAWRGAGRGAASMLMVAVGTGVGASLIIHGRPWPGAHHMGGEIGHVPALGAEDMACPCGRTGHLEALASGVGIARRYAILGGADVDAREVARRAAAGEQRARGAIADAAACLGRVLAGLLTFVDPELVVVGGGVPEIGPTWWEPFVAACRAQTVDVLADVPILPAALGADAALVGAASLVLGGVAAPDDNEGK